MNRNKKRRKGELYNIYNARCALNLREQRLASEVKHSGGVVV